MNSDTKLLYNANIFTLDESQLNCSAIAIRDGFILALGDDQDILTQFGGGAQKLDLGGAPVIPGLIDAHIHLRHYAQSLIKIDCEVPTMKECLRRVAERTQKAAPAEWILGHGWNQNDWQGPFSGGAFPTASDLDQVAPHNPVFLTAKSLHTGWANSKAMQAAGIDANTPDPRDGSILHSEDGQPTGILLEGAMWIVDRAVPVPTRRELAELIHQAQHNLWELGITGVHDFDQRACFEALQRLDQDKRLQLRVVKNLPVELLPHAASLGIRTGFGNDVLRIGGIKAFADGALGPHTAAMLQPYEEDPDNRGMLLLDAEQILEYGQEAVQSGLSMTVHAIGDRANHEVLNAFEKLREFERTILTEDQGTQRNNALHPLRHRIEHVQIIHPEDAHRLAQLGIIASMQPIHATSDMLTADRYWGQRCENAYAWKTQLEHGAVLAFGSDAPVKSPNPFWGLHAAVTRRRVDGTPGPQGWYPAQKLTLQQALIAYTQGAAYTAGTESVQGKLAPGYWADLAVLDRDPFACTLEDIRDITVRGTMVAGNWVRAL